MTAPLKTLSVLALAGALGLPALAQAQGEAQAAVRDSRLEEAFGSTVVSTYPDGRQAELWLKRDGTYNAEGRRHDRSSGVWQIKGDRDAPKLCLKQRRPFPAPFSYCTPVPEGGLDKPWTGKAYTGERISIRVVHGMFDPAPRKSGRAADEKAQATRADQDG
jgi:hypothetical protein